MQPLRCDKPLQTAPSLKGRLSAILVMVHCCYPLTNCAPSITQFSSRRPSLLGHEQIPLKKDYQGKIPIYQTAPNLFVKQKSIEIQAIQDENTTGSLAMLEDERNLLFASLIPKKVGRFINLTIVPQYERTANPHNNNKTDAKTPANNDNQNQTDPKQPQPTDQSQTKDVSPDPIAQAVDDQLNQLLKEFPHLTPEDDSNPSLIKNLRMNVIHRLPNGDVIVRYERDSLSDTDGRLITVKAKIPFEKLRDNTPILSSDLLDVSMTEMTKDEKVERHSTSWEDEYTMRLSGFSEAKSQDAIRLSQKQQQLQKISNQLQQKIASIGAQNRTQAKERDQLIKDKNQANDKADKLETKVKEQQQTIKEQKDTIDSLQATEDKPGDVQDGADGG